MESHHPSQQAYPQSTPLRQVSYRVGSVWVLNGIDCPVTHKDYIPECKAAILLRLIALPESIRGRTSVARFWRVDGTLFPRSPRSPSEASGAMPTTIDEFWFHLLEGIFVNFPVQ